MSTGRPRSRLKVEVARRVPAASMKKTAKEVGRSHDGGGVGGYHGYPSKVKWSFEVPGEVLGGNDIKHSSFEVFESPASSLLVKMGRV